MQRLTQHTKIINIKRGIIDMTRYKYICISICNKGYFSQLSTKKLDTLDEINNSRYVKALKFKRRKKILIDK